MESRHFGILIDVWDPRRGGAEQGLARLAGELLGRGHRVSVLAGEFRGEGDRGVEGLEWQRVPVRGWTRRARNLRLARELPRVARGLGCEVTVGMRHLERVDVLWSHGGCHVASVAARRAAKAGGVFEDPLDRGQLLAEEASLGGRHRDYARLERGLLEGGAGQVIAVSGRSAREFMALVPGVEPRLVVARNGVDLERFHPRHRKRAAEVWRRRLGCEGSDPLVVFCAREPMLKGLGVLAAAWEQAQGMRGDLVVAGVRSPGRWKARTEAVGNRMRTHWVEEVDTAELFAAADLLVHPTYRDTSGLVIQEALASGTPVITTGAAGESLAVVSATCGRVVERAGDRVGLAEALGSFATDFDAGRCPEPDRVRSEADLVDGADAIARVADLVEGAAPREIPRP